MKTTNIADFIKPNEFLAQAVQATTIKAITSLLSQAPERMHETLLSLGSSDKGDKPYLIGLFGQGGSSTYAASGYSWCVSRCAPEVLDGRSDGIGWTVVKQVFPKNRRDPYYAYLAANPQGQVPSLPVAAADAIGLKHGSRFAHLKYNFAGGGSDLRELDLKIRTLAEADIADGQVALLVVASLTPTIEKMLHARIADRRELKPAIVPISQEEIERASDALTALRGAFDKWLFMRDLFAVNAPVFGDRFFGRTNPVAEIRDAISVSKPIGIFGLRKVGKTSILHEIERRSSESGDVVLYMDLLAVPEDVSDTRWLYWDLATQLRERSRHLVPADFVWRLGGMFTDFMAVPSEFPVGTAFDSDLKRVLNLIEATTISPRPKVVLMLDEIERLLPTHLGEPGFKGFFGFFGYFRGVSQQTEDFTMIVTAANPAIQEAAQFDMRDNPVFNYFKEVYLKLLEPAECRQMITQLGKGMGIRFDADACDLIYKLTGGHPFIARQLCSFLADRYKVRPLRLTRAMVESVLDDYLDLKAEKDFNEIFERLSRDFPEERDVCLSLARKSGPLLVADLTKNRKEERLHLRHLIGYQLIQIDESRVSLSIDLMKRWLRRGYASEAE